MVRSKENLCWAAVERNPNANYVWVLGSLSKNWAAEAKVPCRGDSRMAQGTGAGAVLPIFLLMVPSRSTANLGCLNIAKNMQYWAPQVASKLKESKSTGSCERGIRSVRYQGRQLACVWKRNFCDFFV